MHAWFAALVTLLLPAAMVALGTWIFVVGNVQGLVPAVGLIAGAPLAVGFGYLIAGLPLRGAAVAAGFYLLMALCVAATWLLPTDFEDAGTLITIAMVASAGVFVGAVGVAAWDVWRTLAARAAGAA